LELIPPMAGLAVAIGLTWFGDRVGHPENTVSAIVVREPDGGVLCGQLTSDDSGDLLLVATDKKTIPVANAASLNVVQECP
jgi:hypothetical protein